MSYLVEHENTRFFVSPVGTKLRPINGKDISWIVARIADDVREIIKLATRLRSRTKAAKVMTAPKSLLSALCLMESDIETNNMACDIQFYLQSVPISPIQVNKLNEIGAAQTRELNKNWSLIAYAIKQGHITFAAK